MATPDKAAGNRRRTRDAKGYYTSKLTEDLIEVICNAIRAGAPLKTAASYAGISKTSFHNWMSDGRMASGTRLQKRFVAEVDKALADFKVGAIAKISATDDWRAQAWALERRFPDEFGPVQRHTGHDGGEIKHRVAHQIDLSQLSVEELETLMALHTKAGEQVGEVIELRPGQYAELGPGDDEGFDPEPDV